MYVMIVHEGGKTGAATKKQPVQIELHHHGHVCSHPTCCFLLQQARIATQTEAGNAENTWYSLLYDIPPMLIIRRKRYYKNVNHATFIILINVLIKLIANIVIPSSAAIFTFYYWLMDKSLIKKQLTKSKIDLIHFKKKKKRNKKTCSIYKSVGYIIKACLAKLFDLLLLTCWLNVTPHIIK